MPDTRTNLVCRDCGRSDLGPEDFYIRSGTKRRYRRCKQCHIRLVNSYYHKRVHGRELPSTTTVIVSFEPIIQLIKEDSKMTEMNSPQPAKIQDEPECVTITVSLSQPGPEVFILQEEKPCTKCTLSKPLDAFRLRPGTDTHLSWCRDCENEKRREASRQKHTGYVRPASQVR